MPSFGRMSTLAVIRPERSSQALNGSPVIRS